MKTCQCWRNCCIILILIYICILLVTIKLKQQQVDISKKYVNEKLVKVLLEIDILHKNNTELNHQILVLTQKLRIVENSNSNKEKLEGPSEEYELLRRRIYFNTKELWYYVRSELHFLAKTVKGITPFTIRLKKNINEQYLSLLNDIAQLEAVDNHAQWRQKEYIYLRTLVQKRLRFLQNPEDCSKAKKLFCNLISDRQSCGYGCRLHHMVNCLVVAYATKRTLVLDNPHNWGFTSGGISSLTFPLSTCTSSLDNNETVLPWPGNESVQVVNLTLPIAVPNGPNRMRRPLPPPFDPLVLPEDLSRRIQVLHGNPSVWWIGQFVNYIIRKQLSIIDILEEYGENMGFELPVVGVHIRRTDKVGSSHKLEEYMYHVEQYYKQLQLMDGQDLFKTIYLATDDPTLFEEASKKYPDYFIFGDPELYKTWFVANGEIDQSILNFNIDLHFLSQCSYLVCTFSSHLCRLAYEIINGVEYTDASDLVTSLDDEYHFSDQIRRLHVAILPHKSNRPQEMNLQVGDEIEVVGNEWNGYSKGTHLRTKKTLLYPTFKVIQKIEVMYFASYSGIKISSEELEN